MKGKSLPTLSRRGFLRWTGVAGTLAAGAASGLARRAAASSSAAAGTTSSVPGLSTAVGEALEAQSPWVGPMGREGKAEVVASYLAGVRGDDVPTNADVGIVKRARGSRRGFRVQADPGYDHRADVHGRGTISRLDIKAVKKTLRHVKNNPDDTEPRPITVVWHYGWYTHEGRNRRKQTCGYLGGGYSSRNPDHEAEFNDLKNEFGITVDALAWITPDDFPQLHDNYARGYLQARNAGSRYVAFLYESLLNLGFNGQRLSFQERKVPKQLVKDFREMGRHFDAIDRHSRSRIFTLDGRPVIFLYGSHTWGATVDGEGPEYDEIDNALHNCRKVFRKQFGVEPFLVGEEMLFTHVDTFDPTRRRRSANFDAIFVYHHVADTESLTLADRKMSSTYIERLQGLLQRTYDELHKWEQQLDGKKLLVIPSLAAGFWKVGAPNLFSSRSGYADLLRTVSRFHADNYFYPQWGNEAAGKAPDSGAGDKAVPFQVPAPIYTLGSWNEEWEGHAVFPAEFNRSLDPAKQNGFDYPMAIKQAFGWNHYAERRI